MSEIIPILLSGGSGTRLWPLSRADQPKQFISLIKDKSLFEFTLERSNPFGTPVILCAHNHRFLVRKILNKAGVQNASIIMEPVARNTAAAIAAACISVEDKTSLLLVLPSDHRIKNRQAFVNSISLAKNYAKNKAIVTFGIKPSTAHTGYGYIERGVQIEQAYKVKTFHEKPDLETAHTYLEKGTFYWNAGILLFRADVMLEELEKHAPEILHRVRESWNSAQDDLGDILLGEDALRQAPCLSIDYAVMEKSRKCVVVPANFDWDDLGSWEAMWRISDKDKNGNSVNGPVFTQNVSNSYVHSEGVALAVLGLENVIAVSMQDAVFVASRDHAEDIKDMIAGIKAGSQSRGNPTLSVQAPWGAYEILQDQKYCKVRRLRVDPGYGLSLQKHNYLSKNWVVVRGKATLTKDNELFELSANHSVYIPCGTVHRLENKGQENLEIIEVQTGSYFGEDDIIRLEDDYNRLKQKDTVAR